MKYTLFFALLLTTLISCKKNYILDDPNITRTTTTAAPKLLKTFSFDTTKPIGLDTTGRTYYKYDSQNRISEIFDFGTDGLDTTNYSIEKFYYNGNDTLAYKSGGVFNDSYTNGIRTLFDAFYDKFSKYANGRVIQDSTIYNYNGIPYNTEDRKYSYFGANDVRTIYNNVGTATTPGYADTTYSKLTIINNNTVYFRDSTTFFGTPTPAYFEYNIFTNNYIFTSYLDPLFNVYKNAPQAPLAFHGGTIINKNLVQKANYNENEYRQFINGSTTLERQTTYTLTSNYILRNDGYPISETININVVNLPSSSVGTNKLLYFYE